MVDNVAFHSALGLRPAVEQFADSLRGNGHQVHPDLYDGATFNELSAGVAERNRIGIPQMMLA